MSQNDSGGTPDQFGDAMRLFDMPDTTVIWANDDLGQLWKFTKLPDGTVDSGGGPVASVVHPVTGDPLVFGDIGMDSEGTLYGVDWTSLDFYSVNPEDGSASLVGSFPDEPGFYAGNALSFDANGNAYLGTFSSSSLFKFDPSNPAGATEWWTNPDGGMSAGDVVFIGDKAYAAWIDVSYQMTLVELELDANNDVIGYQVLGSLPGDAFGLTVDENGELYVIASYDASSNPLPDGSGLYRLTLPATADPMTPIVLDFVEGSDVSGAGQFFGTTSNAEGHTGQIVPCFTPGTRIATPYGMRLIEDLRIGDLVLTRDHGPQPLRWIGRRNVAAIGNFAPIKLMPGVLIGLERPLLVSPQHRLLLEGYRSELHFGESEVLIAATHLVNGRDVSVQEGGMVTYIHLLFDQHEVIFAEGAATESFHPGEIGLSAMTDAARFELFTLFPQLRAMPESYGPAARKCLKRHEGLLLMA